MHLLGVFGALTRHWTVFDRAVTATELTDERSDDEDDGDNEGEDKDKDFDMDTDAEKLIKERSGL